MPVPVETVQDTGLTYYLIAYDDAGAERKESDGGLLSRQVMDTMKQGGFTDVILMSHGWKGDVPEAKDQYRRWISAAAKCSGDLAQLNARPGGFKPLLIGIHWPSLPFGDEEFETAAASMAPAGPSDVELVDRYAKRLNDTPEVRETLWKIFAAARQPSAPPAQLPPGLRQAYASLGQEVDLSPGGPGAAPGEDQDGFDPDRTYLDATSGPVPFSLWSRARDALLSPLRQVSFWKMKQRACAVGETGAHNLLRDVLAADPDVKVHLMGHSFGCVVVSAAVAGPKGGKSLPRPVQSLLLVQGALSLWSYTSDIPAKAGLAGYFHAIAAERRVNGPVVTTRSRYDRAVGWWYPLGARAARQIAYAAGAVAVEDLPKYGAVGSFGLRGRGLVLEDATMFPADAAYDFRGGRVYNLDASRFIFRGGGASGAHSDIDNPEVGHAFWAAVQAPAADAAPAGGGSQVDLAAAGIRDAPQPAKPGPAGDPNTAGPVSEPLLGQWLRDAEAIAKQLRARVRIEIEINPPKE
jgi:hypothetical protein